MTEAPHGLAVRAVDDPPPSSLFCYGTLLEEGFTSSLLERRVRAAPAVLHGYDALDLPGCQWQALRQAAEGAVEGRLYRGLGAEDFRRLDLYEGVAEGLYERATVTVDAGRGPEPAAVYLPTRRTLSRYGG